MAMFMIDVQVLLTTTIKDICKRLHSSNLVPTECPIFVVESHSGVFGAGVSGECSFTEYEGRDIELNPAATVTAVLTVGYIPPKTETGGGGVTPCVSCFLVNDQPLNRRCGFHRAVIDGVSAVFMERAAPPARRARIYRGGPADGAVARGPAASAPSHGEPAGRPLESSYPKTPWRKDGSPSAPQTEEGDEASRNSGYGEKSDHDGAAQGEIINGGIEASRPSSGGKPPRRSMRASTMASSRAASPEARVELLPPSMVAPLEAADTILLVGSDSMVLGSTAAWLKKLLPQAVLVGGVSGCALVIGDRVFPSDLRRRARSALQVPQLVGIAFRGVHALAVSSKGFEGLGPVFRVDNVAQSEEGAPQGQPGKFLRDVVVVEEAGGAASSRPATAVEILHNEALQGPVWAANDTQTVYLGVSSSPADLFNPREDRGEAGADVGDARGIPPIAVMSDMEQALKLADDVSPGQFARFMCTTPELSLIDTAVTYRLCKQRLDRQGATVLSSIRFACSLRPDRVEADVEKILLHAFCNKSGHELLEQRQRQQQEEGQHPAQGWEAFGNCVVSLHQQETVQFCRTLKAPSAGVFCDGELGPLPTLVRGILPRTAQVRLQSFTACSAVLCWIPHTG